ncbi:hypothetical protein [Macrococcus capreoli]|uniref:hypothetical protein n=1 Tax=Macrococcus capreoli TaxID=2982690 RepID=UPI003EE6B540
MAPIKVKIFNEASHWDLEKAINEFTDFYNCRVKRIDIKPFETSSSYRFLGIVVYELGTLEDLKRLLNGEEIKVEELSRKEFKDA